MHWLNHYHSGENLSNQRVDYPRRLSYRASSFGMTMKELCLNDYCDMIIRDYMKMRSSECFNFLMR